MKESLILLLLFVGAALCDAEEKQKFGLGMWVWPQKAFDTAEARDKLLAFCDEEGITHLDQHVGIKKSASGPSLQNAEALAKLVVAARKQGVTVSGLQGSGKCSSDITTRVRSRIYVKSLLSTKNCQRASGSLV